MNKVILVGRLARDPESRRTQATENLSPLCITTYTLAVDRNRKGEADFIKCKAFGKAAEFAEKYFTKGLRVAISGRLETGSYTNRDGKKVYTVEVIVDGQEFAQSKKEETSQEFEMAKQSELPFV